MTILAKQFFRKSVEREYIALVWGDVKNDEGEINAPVGRNPKNRLQMIVYEDLEGGKDAITNYKVIERFGYVTLVSCKLKTGRTHQIRVHMNYLGNCIVGDDKYKKKFKKIKNINPLLEARIINLKRQFLHAKTIGFIHPKNNKEMIFNSILPQELAKILKMLRNTDK